MAKTEKGHGNEVIVSIRLFVHLNVILNGTIVRNHKKGQESQK